MRLFWKILFVTSCLWSTTSCAQENYSDNPVASAFIDSMVSEEGFDRQQLEKIFAEAKKQDAILEAIARPAEKTKAWYEYRPIFLNQQREDEGVEFFKAHRATLEKAEQEFGVPAEIIVAILGVETYYGRLAGRYRVLDALSTLAFDYPKRSPFFTKELKHYLMLTKEQGFDPAQMLGSYAGAMGYGQFMPSSYRSYAIDYDGDGVKDIWNNAVDAIGSVANYFKAHGWRPGQPVVVAATATAELPEDWFVSGRDGLKPTRTVAQFAQAGLKPKTEADPEALATAMKFELENGYEYWVGLHNFYVITRYNHSSMYAMSVHQLSQRLAARMVS